MIRTNTSQNHPQIQAGQRRQHRAAARGLLRDAGGLPLRVPQLRRPLLLGGVHGGGVPRLAQDTLPPLEGPRPGAPPPQPGELHTQVLDMIWY